MNIGNEVGKYTREKFIRFRIQEMVEELKPTKNVMKSCLSVLYDQHIILSYDALIKASRCTEHRSYYHGPLNASYRILIKA